MTDEAYPNQASMVRRTDIALRARYPHLETRLFELAPHSYCIWFDRNQLDADTAKDEFNSHIRPATVAIKLTNDIPCTNVREIWKIEDHRIPVGFEGCPLTMQDTETILLGFCPDLPVPISQDSSTLPILTICFTQPLTPQQETCVRAFMAGHLPEWNVEIRIEPPQPEAEAPSTGPADSLKIRPRRLRPAAPSFVQRDEAFWFENLDRIFDGKLSEASILDRPDADMACYIDGTSFQQIDLRQAILLYDTIYLTPPIRSGDFWDRQSLTKDDLLTSVEAGRLRFVLTQAEERTDPVFLEAAFERNPTAIVGRRRTAAIVANDIVHMANEYTLARPDLRPLVRKLAERLEEETHLSAATLGRLLLWPVYARRACLLPLQDRGAMGLPQFGLGQILAEELRVTIGREFDLEAHGTSLGVHLAHALGATLIPPISEMAGWIEPRRIVGDRLNFFRSFNGRVAAAWAANERFKEEKRNIVPPLPLFHFEKRATIEQLLAVSSKGSTRRRGRALLSRLADLAPEDRPAEIDQLAQDLYEMGWKRHQNTMIVDWTSDTIDVGAFALEISLLPFKSAWDLLGRIIALGRRASRFDRFIQALEDDLNATRGRNADIDFLSKISRVARLREPT